MNNNNITVKLKIGDIEFYASGEKIDVDKEIKSFYKKFGKAQDKKHENDYFYDFLMPNIYENKGYIFSVDVSADKASGVDFENV